MQIVKCKYVWHIFSLVVCSSFNEDPEVPCWVCIYPSQSKSQKVHKRLVLPSPEVQVILPTLLSIPKLTTLEAYHDAFLKYPRGNTDSHLNIGQNICIRTWIFYYSCVLLSDFHRPYPTWSTIEIQLIFLATVSAKSSLNPKSHSNVRQHKISVLVMVFSITPLA